MAMEKSMMKKADTLAMDQPRHAVTTRPARQGTAGRRIPLLTNHFKVTVESPNETFYQYNVIIESETKQIIDNKVFGRRILDTLYKTYSSLLDGKKFAYDGEKSLYTVGPLPGKNFDFTVVLEDSFTRRGSPSETSKRSRRSLKARTFNVKIRYAAKIPLRSISLVLQGDDQDQAQDALRVLDIFLREQAANRGCLLVRQSFFHDDSRNFLDIGGGVAGCKGFHSSFRPTQGGLSLNIDVTTTMILKPGSVVDFLKANQNVRDLRSIDWVKAKRMLKSLLVRTTHTKREFKITGLSDKPCNEQFFLLNVKNEDGTIAEGKGTQITVYDYFTKRLNIEITDSANLPCLDVGKPNRPNYLPVELCNLSPLQRYKKALSSLQRASLVEKSRQKPQERMRAVTNAIRTYRFDNDPLLVASGISIEKQLTEVVGRVLDAPKLLVGTKREECLPHRGRWNFNNKELFEPTNIRRWAIINFSDSCDTSSLSQQFIYCGKKKGINIDRPYVVINEDRRYRRASPVTRVEKMFEVILAKLPPGEPPKTTPNVQFLLCVLPERKNSELYGPWKKKCLVDFGWVNQCIAPIKINDQYLTNLLLKINSKLGGINSMLDIEHQRCIPMINETPTMIMGMDVCHGPPGRADIPSIAAVVGSQSWQVVLGHESFPNISKYGGCGQSQAPKTEMIECLFKPQPDGKDVGIMRELLLNFYWTSEGKKPTQIIVFRDGVSESQFSQVLDKELDQMKKAYQFLDNSSNIPKFTVIVAQKNHHTRLFQPNAPENVPPGTVVDSSIVHPTYYDFYMCSHAGIIGTSRPTRYNVLLDQIGFSPDDLQCLVHSLSYVGQRSTSATSIVAPVYYAHLQAKQLFEIMKNDEMSDNYSSGKEGSFTSVGDNPVPEVPILHRDVKRSMFFC